MSSVIYSQFSFPIILELDQQIRLIAEILLKDFRVNDCKMFKNTSKYGFSLEGVENDRGIFLSFKFIKFFNCTVEESSEIMIKINDWIDREILSLENIKEENKGD